jgi:hypothetical protein
MAVNARLNIEKMPCFCCVLDGSSLSHEHQCSPQRVFRRKNGAFYTLKGLALRAFFVDHEPLIDIAQRLGYRYGSLRNLVHEFRAQCRRGQAPPFFNHSS